MSRATEGFSASTAVLVENMNFQCKTWLGAHPRSCWRCCSRPAASDLWLSPRLVSKAISGNTSGIFPPREPDRDVRLWANRALDFPSNHFYIESLPLVLAETFLRRRINHLLKPNRFQIVVHVALIVIVG